MIGLGKNIIYTQHWFGYTEMTVQVYLLVSVIGPTGLFPTASAPLYTMPCTHWLHFLYITWKKPDHSLSSGMYRSQTLGFSGKTVENIYNGEQRGRLDYVLGVSTLVETLSSPEPLCFIFLLFTGSSGRNQT